MAGHEPVCKVIEQRVSVGFALCHFIEEVDDLLRVRIGRIIRYVEAADEVVLRAVVCSLAGSQVDNAVLDTQQRVVSIACVQHVAVNLVSGFEPADNFSAF
jgi:hypothetical protein